MKSDVGVNSLRSHVEKVPARNQSGGVDVIEIRLKVVATAGTETDHSSAARSQMIPELLQNLAGGSRRQERHDVAGADNQVKLLPRQVEFAEIADVPIHGRVVLDGGGNELRVEVDSRDVVTEPGKFAAHSAGTAPGVENPRGARDHRINEPGLAVEVPALRAHLLEPGDVPGGVARIVFLLGFPQAFAFHASTLPSRLSGHLPGR